MKTCPRCGALVFDDVDTCMGCLYDFDQEDAAEHVEIATSYLSETGYRCVRTWSCPTGDYVVARDGDVDVVVKVIVAEPGPAVPELAIGDAMRDEMRHALIYYAEDRGTEGDLRADAMSIALNRETKSGTIRHLVGLCSIEIGEDGEMTCW